MEIIYTKVNISMECITDMADSYMKMEATILESIKREYERDQDYTSIQVEKGSTNSGLEIDNHNDFINFTYNHILPI